MRICFLANELSLRDGWGRYSVSLLEQLQAQGIECLVLSSRSSRENVLPHIKEYRVLPPLFANRAVKLASLAAAGGRIKRWMQSADLIHSLVELYAPIPYLLKTTVPWVVTLHGTYAVHPLEKFPSNLFYPRIFRAAQGLICVSHFTQKEVDLRIFSGNTFVVNNGVNFARFQTAASAASTIPVVLSVGAVMPRKGYHISIPAIAEVKKTIPDLKYVIVGNHKNKKYVDYLKALIRYHALDDTVVFIGEKLAESELISQYYQASLFLLTPVNIAGSKFEGFGQVYLEASACGKPVIGTLNCGAEDAVRDGETGLLVPQNDVKKTAEAVVKVLKDNELARRLGENGRKYAQDMDWSRIAGRYVDLYRRI